jgi:hypothetical protein
LPAQADEPPELQLKFVRQLRSKRMADLALQYLKELQKNPPKELAPLLPLEIARTQLSLAREKPAGQRLEMLKQARAGLQEYFDKNAARPEVAPLKLEIVRVTVYEGQALLGQAYRAEDPNAQKEYASKARQKFKDARGEFDKAIDYLEKLVKGLEKLKNPETKALHKQLARELLQGKFDKAKTYIDEAHTILDNRKTADLKDQNKLYEDSQTFLKEVAFDYEQKEPANPEASFLAIAWLIDVQKKTLPDAAEKAYHRLKDVPEKEAEPAQRWARYFYIQAIEDGDFKAPAPFDKMPKPKFIEALCDTWNAKFPRDKQTPEGQGVQFELAKTYLAQAQAIGKDFKNAAAAKLYTKAQQIFAKLAETDSDLAERATQYNVAISILRMGKDTPVAKLRDFEECYLKARFEMSRLQAVTAEVAGAKNDKERTEALKTRQKQFQVIIAAFKRALQLTTPQTPVHKIHDVQYFLDYIYLLSGDDYRAAVMGEYLARRDPATRRSPLAAAYAIQAYSKILNKDKEQGNRQRLNDLTRYVLETKGSEWKDELVTPIARWQLALIHLREAAAMVPAEQPNPSPEQREKLMLAYQKQVAIYQDALAELEKVPKDFSAYTFAQCQLGLTALNAQKKSLEIAKAATDARRTLAAKNDPDKAAVEHKKAEEFGKKADEFRTRALKALGNLKEIPHDADAATAQMFFVAQLEHGKLIYEDAANFQRDEKLPAAAEKFKLMATFSDNLVKQFNELKTDIGSDAREKLEAPLKTLTKFARVGLGEMEYRNGAYEKVLSKEVTGDIVEQIKTLGKAPGDINLNDFQITGELLGLALRAHVQKGQLKEAKELLGLIKRVKSAGLTEQGIDPTAALSGKLINDLRVQITDLKASKKKDRLDATIKNYGKFFDLVLADQDSKSLSSTNLFFLAEGYATLGEHQKAADLYGRMTKPPPFDAKTVSLSKEEKATLAQLPAEEQKVFWKQQKEKYDRGEQLWWMVQVYQARELRKAGKLDQADKLLATVLNDPKAISKLVAGKEKIHVLEDRGLWGKAITEWSNFLQNQTLQRQARDNKDMKKFYFEAYYQFVYCWYKFSQTTGKKNEEKYLKRAADYILRLETAKSKDGWQLIEPQVQELLRESPALSRVYKEMKKESK